MKEPFFIVAYRSDLATIPFEESDVDKLTNFILFALSRHTYFIPSFLDGKKHELREKLLPFVGCLQSQEIAELMNQEIGPFVAELLAVSPQHYFLSLRRSQYRMLN